MIGLFEPVCAPWKVDGIPDDSSFTSLQPDWDRMGPYLERAMSRVPVSGETGIRTFFCGPESFTPDLAPVVGRGARAAQLLRRAPGSTRSASSPAAASAAWWPTGSIDRRARRRRHRLPHRPPAAATSRTPSTAAPAPSSRSAWSTQCHYPNRSMHDRPRREAVAVPRPPGRARARTSRTSAAGRAPTGTPARARPPTPARSRGGRPAFWVDWEAEHRRLPRGRDRDGHVVHVEVPRAGPRRRHRARPAVGQRGERRAGHSSRTRSGSTRRGTLEADLTVTKLGDDEFFVVATDTAHRHVETRLRRHAEPHHAFVDRRHRPASPRSTCRARGRATCCSRSRPPTCRTRRSRSAPPARSTSASHACCACASRTSASSATSCTCRPSRRCTCTTASSRPGPPFGLRHAGLKALASLRMEKGYRDYGHDIDNTDGVLEAGPRLRGGARQAGRLHRPRRRRRPQGGRPAHPPPRAGAAAPTPSR